MIYITQLIYIIEGQENLCPGSARKRKDGIVIRRSQPSLTQLRHLLLEQFWGEIQPYNACSARPRPDMMPGQKRATGEEEISEGRK